MCAGISQSLSAAKGELYRQSDSSQQNLPWANYSQILPGACPPILCKLREMTTAACNAYHVSPPLSAMPGCKADLAMDGTAVLSLVENCPGLHALSWSIDVCAGIAQNGSDTIASGSVTINAQAYTTVAVAWLPQNSPAWF